ncbi:MAG: hypothetical protein ACRDS9_01755 [Pseudonocardiaceae bacterium]
MNGEEWAVSALDECIGELEACGLVRLWHTLARGVAAFNVDRHEPDLGDDLMSLGVTMSVNFRNRAIRRAQGHAAERAEDHWRVDGLRVGTKHNSLVMTLGGRQFFVMKAPVVLGRKVTLGSSLSGWDSSDLRGDAAARNSAALDGFRSDHLGQAALFSNDTRLAPLNDFMLVWSADPESALTAGYLGVPIQGARPFAALTQLWWDETSTTGAREPVAPTGPSFDSMPVTQPHVQLRSRASKNGEA